MGKNLSGKNLEKGITQRKDCIYSARFISLSGKRREKHFKDYQDARKWLAKARFEDEEECTGAPGIVQFRDITVDDWFEYWMSTFKSKLSPNTLRNYRDQYTRDVKPRIGRMRIRDVRPMHMQQMLLLNEELPYYDKKSCTMKVLKMKDLVFVSKRTGEPVKNSTYDTALYKVCDRAGLKPFCMHALRHTFATRCIERGVQPKVLQRLLGHANLSTTMDRYVYVTEESLAKGMELFESDETERHKSECKLL